MSIDRQYGTKRGAGVAGAKKSYDDDKKLLALMKKHRGGVTSESVVQHFGWEVTRCRKAFYALRDEGLAKRHMPADGGPVMWVLS
jgi:hypothetical protein